MGKGLMAGLREKGEGDKTAGLEALTGLAKTEVKAYSPNPRAVRLPIAAIVVKRQVRTHFDEQAVRERAADMQANGQLQPVVVVQEEGRFVLKMGEYRLRAAKLLGWGEIDAVIRDSAGTLEQLAENIQRNDLMPYEIAEALQQAKIEKNLTSDTQLAEAIHKPQSYVSRYLGLLTVRQDIREAIEDGRLAASFYFNNVKLFKDGIPEWLHADEGLDSGKPAPGGARTASGKKPAGRKGAAGKRRVGYWAQLSEPAARAVFALLAHHAKQLKLKPLAPIGELDAKQATRLINERAPEILQALNKKKR